MKMKNLSPIDLDDLQKDQVKLSFANLLRAYRTREGLTRDEMAKLLGMSTLSYTWLETGKFLASRKRAEEIAQKLGIPSGPLVALAIQDRSEETAPTE